MIVGLFLIPLLALSHRGDPRAIVGCIALTVGRSRVKPAPVAIALYSEATIRSFLDDKRSGVQAPQEKLLGLLHMLDAAKPSAALAGARQELQARMNYYGSGAYYFADMPAPLSSTSAGWAGSFRLRAPSTGNFVLFARRVMPANHQFDYWLIPIVVGEGERPPVALTESNLTRGPDSPLLTTVDMPAEQAAASSTERCVAEAERAVNAAWDARERLALRDSRGMEAKRLSDLKKRHRQASELLNQEEIAVSIEDILDCRSSWQRRLLFPEMGHQAPAGRPGMASSGAAGGRSPVLE